MNNTIKRGERVFAFSETLPNNERVNKMREEQSKRDELIEKEKKEKRLKEEQSQLKDEELLKQQQAELAKLENSKDDQEIADDAIQKLIAFIQDNKNHLNENNLNKIFRSLLDNVSPYEINFSGIELNIVYYTTLMNILKQRGKSLHTLNLSRKGLTDKQHSGIISKMLKENKTLRRLELEGNNFGPDGLKKFADALRINKTLQYLDLENNNLTNFGEDTSGVEELFDALKGNFKLISINLANTYLTSVCWQKIIACLRHNKTLIHLDISMNQHFQLKDPNQKNEGTTNEKEQKYEILGLNNEQIKEVKDLLERNKKEYDDFKKLEWKERKSLKSEDEEMRNYTTTVSQMKIEESMKKDDKKFIENLYFECFNDIMAHGEDDFMKNVEEFYAKTKERLTKPKKKGKGGKAK